MSSRWAQCLQGAHVLWLQNKHRSPSTPMLDTCYMVFVLMFCLLSCLYFGFFRWNFSNQSLAYLQPYLFLPTLSNKRSFFLLFLHFFKTMRMPEHNRFKQLLCQHPHLCFSSILNNWKGHTLLKSFNSTDLFCCCCNNVTLLCDDTKCKGV